MTSKPEVLIIGGGVIGVAIANSLSRAGSEVVLIDRGLPGHGCSYGNAGWVAPGFATPLPRPGLLMKAARWMLDPRSPLRIPLRPDPALIAWLVRFLWNTRQERFIAGTRALVELSQYSLEAFEKLASDHRGGLDFQRKGLLQVALTPDGVTGLVRDLRMMEAFRVEGTVMDEEGVREFEPSLTGPVAGGVHYPGEAHLEPLEAVEALANRADDAGAQIIPSTEAIRFRREADRIAAVLTSRGWIEPETVVLASGVWSRPLAAQVGLRLPLFGGKGYSMTVDRSATALSTPVLVAERKVAITPHSGRLRLAGTLELVRDDETISPRRVDAIRDTAREVLALPEQAPIEKPWSGLRPCAPDGLPLIGRSRRVPNLIVAAGHQMLGLQTAPATARLVTDLMYDRTPPFNPQPFSPARYE